VDSRVKGMSRLAAAGAIVILASGLAACGSSGGSKGASGQQAQTPQQAIQLAANTSRAISSFVATVNVKLSSGANGVGAVNLTGTVTEQLHPSLIAEADYSTFAAGGQSFPGGLSEIITANSVYIKLGLLTQALHTNKPWIAIPFSALEKASGVNLGSLFSQLQTSSPLSQSQLFAGATDVKKVGTGSIDGVPVTEYSGTVSMTRALSKLPADLRSSLGPVITKAGIKSAKFTEWLDAQNQVRKVVVTESGSSFTETITTTVSSINQPVNIAVPPASQTSSLPASVLNQM
jgi:hypothetical protein